MNLTDRFMVDTKLNLKMNICRVDFSFWQNRAEGAEVANLKVRKFSLKG